MSQNHVQTEIGTKLNDVEQSLRDIHKKMDDISYKRGIKEDKR